MHWFNFLLERRKNRRMTMTGFILLLVPVRSHQHSPYLDILCKSLKQSHSLAPQKTQEKVQKNATYVVDPTSSSAVCASGQ